MRKFRKWIKNLPIGDGCKIVLAYSGGGDSAGMAALFLSAFPRPKVELALCHINHKLRGKESERDEKMCSQIAKKLNLPFYSFKANTKPKKGESVEEWARKERYNLLERCRKKIGFDFIATAHTMDDQAETIILRIARGTGIEGLKGISKILNNKIIRPCLSLRAFELRNAANECGIEFVEDSSNKETRFLRNKVRMNLMPVIEKELPSFVEGLFNLSQIKDDSEGNYPSIAKRDGNSLYYPLRCLAVLSRKEAIDVFRAGVKAINGDLRGFSKRHFEGIANLITAKKGAFVPLPKGLCAEREDTSVCLKQKRIGAVR
ncbi:MAG: tRNA lysidine(34) synthetase TilS [Thermoanaerobaculaceae bacterium]|nr:tRNA lysidine(34) synthetase TilS [Thermoanaerobaculaceae bacterium]